MIWLIQDFDLLAVLLRALTLSFEALTLGGVLFLLFVATSHTAGREAARRLCAWMALGLALVQVLSAAESAAMLMGGGSGFSFHDIATADFFVADLAIVVAAVLLFLVNWRRLEMARWLNVPLALIILAGSVALSHAPSQLSHRLLLILLTAAHHLGAAAWIGAMPFLIVTMRSSEETGRLHELARRFSTMAMLSVGMLVLAGIGMTKFYVGWWGGLYETSYGLMVLAKIYLLLLTLALGAGNYFLLQRTRDEAGPFQMRLRRFSEAEIGLGFTAILIAASLTSQPPAADLQPKDRLTGHEIVRRLSWKEPRLTTPSFSQLKMRSSLKDKLEIASYTGGSPNDAMDQAWSEYNHHWAGIIVLAAGAIALLARFRSQRWARNWPLLFIGLAIFIVLRADPEAWPLGPHGFWVSFAESDVLEHRTFALIITAFAVFEWAVETGRLQSRRAALVFPGLCAIGGAFLFTHSHSLGGLKDETLVEFSHGAIALLGVTAGWSRWLQLRLPDSPDPDGRNSRIKANLSWVWPLCFVLVGVVLLNYRES